MPKYKCVGKTDINVKEQLIKPFIGKTAIHFSDEEKHTNELKLSLKLPQPQSRFRLEGQSSGLYNKKYGSESQTFVRQQVPRNAPPKIRPLEVPYSIWSHCR